MGLRFGSRARGQGRGRRLCLYLRRVLFVVVEKRRSHSKKQSKKQKTKRGVLFVFIFSLWTDDEF